jgi:ABC-2 type transport system ATP-binding protein
VIRRDGGRVCLAFDPQVVAPAELIQRVTSRHAIRDLFVENPPIETIVARLYAVHGRGADGGPAAGGEP